MDTFKNIFFVYKAKKTLQALLKIDHLLFHA